MAYHIGFTRTRREPTASRKDQKATIISGDWGIKETMPGMVADLPLVEITKEGCCKGMVGRLLTCEEKVVFVYFEGKHCSNSHTGIEIPKSEIKLSIKKASII